MLYADADESSDSHAISGLTSGNTSESELGGDFFGSVAVRQGLRCAPVGHRPIHRIPPGGSTGVFGNPRTYRTSAYLRTDLRESFAFHRQQRQGPRIHEAYRGIDQ